jgi:hypothetical protein
VGKLRGFPGRVLFSALHATEEATDSLGSPADTGDIKTNLFRPQVSWKSAPFVGDRGFEREHIGSLQQSISQDGLNIIGKAKDAEARSLGVRLEFDGRALCVLGERVKQGAALGVGHCEGSIMVDRDFGLPSVQSMFRYGIAEGRDPGGSRGGRR